MTRLWKLARLVEWADNTCHHYRLHVRWLCEAADICYGVPPDCFGPPGDQTPPGRFAMFMHRLLYGDLSHR